MVIRALSGIAKIAARYAPKAGSALSKIKTSGGLTGLGAKISTAGKRAGFGRVIGKGKGALPSNSNLVKGLTGVKPPAGLAAAAGTIFKGGKYTGGRAVNMAKELTGIASTQRGLATFAKPGLWNKAKGLAGIGLGALGIKWTKDLLTGTEAAAEDPTTFADDPFQAEYGFPESPVNPGEQPGNRQPLWDAPDILPDFIEDRLEGIDPKLLGYGTAAAGLLAAAGTGAWLNRDWLGEQWDNITGKTPKKKPKGGSKKGKSKSSKSQNPTFKTLGKEWKRLSKAGKAKYEGEFSAYVKVQKEMRSTVKKGGKRSNPKPKKGSQQNRMQAAAKKWKKYKGSLSYQEFMSKALSK